MKDRLSRSSGFGESGGFVIFNNTPAIINDKSIVDSFPL